MADLDGTFKYVTTKTPQRLSFIGGGTDFPDFYRVHGGGVVSTAIDKFIYVTVKQLSRLFGEGYRLNYSTTENVQSLDEIENAVARECLRLVPVDPPLFIGTIADLPASSGLGSSSSFAVGLLFALHMLRGEDPSAGQLAEEACQVELVSLARPIGKQDQYAAAFGGLNYIAFEISGRVRLDPIIMTDVMQKRLAGYSMMFWTGIRRSATDVLTDQRNNIADRTGELTRLRDMAKECRELLLGQDLDMAAFGALLDKNWRLKRRLSANVSNAFIDEAYEAAIKAGALGGKIAGAGGGGFLYLVVPPQKQMAVRKALEGLEEIRLRLENRGARSVYGNVV